MMFTTEMTQLFAVALEKDRERVTEALLREGVMQFISITTLEGQESLSQVRPEVALNEITDLRRRIGGMLHIIGVIPTAPRDTDLNQRSAVDVHREVRTMDQLDQQRDALRERQRSLNQEILKLEDIQRQVDLYGLDINAVTLPGQHSLLSTQTGRIPLVKREGFERQLRSLPALNLVLGELDEESHHLLLFMKRDREAVERILAQAGWSRLELPADILAPHKDLLSTLTTKLATLRQEQQSLQGQVEALIRQHQEHLGTIWTQLRINELCAKIQTHFQTSSRAFLFAGWLPTSKRTTVQQKAIEACEGRCHLEWYEARSSEQIGDEIPVQLRNPKALTPFQMLVSQFGIPEYGTIDPTSVVMPLYLAMFGLMFADVGQGLVLVLLGLWGMKSFHGDAAHRTWEKLCGLMVWCGAAAMLFGVLVGSYFGLAWFKPLWFDFHGIVSGHAGHGLIHDLSDILALTVYFGMSVILLGLCFNWINLIRTRHWAALIFDKAGLLGGWLYCGGVTIAWQYVAGGYKTLGPGNRLFWWVGLPALGFLLKEPCHYLMHHRGRKQENLLLAILNGLMQWLVEMLEIFTGYLSNTLSFMRVAALGIAHVCLMTSFFTMAAMTEGISRFVILILGNVLVIGLEGLSAGIQALRLNYYEFFTKFFHGTGRLHTPISLTSEL